MSERNFDGNSFELNDNAIENSDVDDLQQQLRGSFTKAHVSLPPPPPPPPMKRKKHSMQSPPNRGRHHRTFRILVITLAITVVLASVIAFGSYLAIQRRNSPPRNNVESPPDINFPPSPTISPTSRLPTLSPVSSPVVTTPATAIPVPTISPTSSSVVTAPTTRTPVPILSPTSPPVIVIAPTTAIPVSTSSPTSSPVITTSRTIIPDSKNTRSPTLNPTSTRAPTVLAMPIFSERPGAPTMSPQASMRPTRGAGPSPAAVPVGKEPSIPTKPHTRAPTGFTPTFIAPTPYHRAPTEQPQVEPAPVPTGSETICRDTADCQIIANFPDLGDFLCFDADLGIADNCARSCGLCGDVSTAVSHCVDDKSAFFLVNYHWGYQSCKWLSTKPELRRELCVPGEDGYKHCPRLCGRCELCQDDVRAAVFINYDIGYKTCSWLAKQPTYQTSSCQPGEFGYQSCPKTCGRCSVLEYSQTP